jgi:hypothetical protein
LKEEEKRKKRGISDRKSAITSVAKSITGVST